MIILACSTGKYGIGLYKVKGEKLMFRLGPTELILILVIVILLFGVGRISKIAGELGSGLRSFRQGLKPEGEESSESEETKTE